MRPTQGIRRARVARASATVLSAGLVLGAHPAIAATPQPTLENEPASVTIQIDSPGPNEVVKNKVDMAPVRGSAQSGSGEAVDFDVVVAIDVSKSTRFPAGIDVDEDEEIGFNPQLELVEPGKYPDDMVCSDPEDTILAAEVQAARLLLGVLKPGRTQVSVITFSGEVDPKTGRRKDPQQQDAIVQIPLTDDFDAVHKVLDQILERGPFGATNMAAAVQLSVVELAGITGAESKPRAHARKVVLFLTDGVPSFPFGRGAVMDPEDTDAAINAARLAHKAGITINTFALGGSALASPVAVNEMARITVGTYTPVRNPGEIVGFLQGISFANVDDVVITNLSTQEVSYDVSISPDGTFNGFVPVQPGANKIRVTALASDGGESTIELEFNFEKSGLNERELARELERIKKRNKELARLIESNRIRIWREQKAREASLQLERDDEEP